MEGAPLRGQKPVLCKDVPGFIANRMQHALWREAISIVEENGIADAATVDEAVRFCSACGCPSSAPWRTPTWWVPT